MGGNLKVASFNVLNFFNGNGLGGGFPTARGANTQFELDRQKAKEVSALSAMNADIVGLMEIENDAGPNSALAELVAALNAAMGAGTYAYVDTGVIGTDEIKVALIYKPAAVTPVGAFALLTSAVDPRFIDTRNRPTLAQTFQHASSGQKLTVAVNHLKSKGSACGAGDPTPRDGSGNCNGTRTEAAAALADWLADRPDRERRSRLPDHRRPQLVHVRDADHDARRCGLHEPRPRATAVSPPTRTCSTASPATSTTRSRRRP